MEKTYDKNLLLEAYRKMTTIRAYESKVEEIFLAGELPGFTHLYIGEEACGVGVCSNLNNDDYIESTHRGHGHCIAKGADVKKMMAELYGKAPTTPLAPSISLISLSVCSVPTALSVLVTTWQWAQLWQPN